MVGHDGFFRYSTCYRTTVLLLVFVSMVMLIYYTTQTDQTGPIDISVSADELINFLDNLDSPVLANQKPLMKPQKAQDSAEAEDPQVNQSGEGSVELTKVTSNAQEITKLDMTQSSSFESLSETSKDDSSMPGKDQDVEVTPEIEASSQTDIKEPILETDVSDRKNDTEPVETDDQEAGKLEKPLSIPYILHMSAPSEMLPECYRPLIESCTSQNPDWEYYLWRDQDKKEFMRVYYPLHSDWLMKVPTKQQDELFRYFVLMRLGGLFLDLDMQCVSPLTPVLANISIFLADERPEIAHIVRKVNRSIDNTVIAGAPGHKLFLQMLEYLADLPDEPVDTRGFLAAACRSLKVNCSFNDYRYFGSSLDKKIDWQEACRAVLDDLIQGVEYKSEEPLFYQQQHCIKLRDQNWLADSPELSNSDNKIVAYHTYTRWESCLAENQKMINITEALEPQKRVLHYI